MKFPLRMVLMLSLSLLLGACGGRTSTYSETPSTASYKLQLGSDYIAIDSSGNAWVSNYNDTVTKITPNASADCSSGCTTFSGSPFSGETYGVAVDGANNVWVAGGALVEIPAGATSCSSGCASYPVPSTGVAIDGGGNVWVTTFQGVTEVIPSSATATCSAGCIHFTGGGLLASSGIAVDATNTVWVANGFANTTTQAASVTRIAPGASPSCSSGCTNYTNGGLVGAMHGVAVDGQGNVWVSNVAASGGSNPGSVTRIAPNAATDCSSGCINYSGASGMPSSPESVAIDGNGAAWVAGSNLLEILPGAAPNCSSGCQVYMEPFGMDGVAIDGSGNVWETQQTQVMKVLGIGTATVDPIVRQTR